MGTNYYWRPPESSDYCGSCGRGDRGLHIGKSSAGWTFTFQAHPSLGITSYTDWLRVFHGEGKYGKIFDEYGTNVSVEDFKEMVRVKAPSKLNHTVEMRKNPRFPNYVDENLFLDSEGHSFVIGYFS